MDKISLKEILGEIDPRESSEADERDIVIENQVRKYLDEKYGGANLPQAYSSGQQEIFMERYLKKVLPHKVKEHLDEVIPPMAEELQTSLKSMVTSEVKKKASSTDLESLKSFVEVNLPKLSLSHSALADDLSFFVRAQEETKKRDRAEFSGHTAKGEKERKSLKKELDDHKQETSERLKELINMIKLSGFGGGSIPTTLYIETPVALADNATTAFTFKNKPTYITVGGQLTINGDGYTLTGTGLWTATFDNAPMVGQTIHSFWQ